MSSSANSISKVASVFRLSFSKRFAFEAFDQRERPSFDPHIRILTSHLAMKNTKQVPLRKQIALEVLASRSRRDHLKLFRMSVGWLVDGRCDFLERDCIIDASPSVGTEQSRRSRCAEGLLPGHPRQANDRSRRAINLNHPDLRFDSFASSGPCRQIDRPDKKTRQPTFSC